MPNHGRKKNSTWLKSIFCAVLVLLLGLFRGLFPGEAVSFTAWLPYWDAQSALAEAERLEARLETAVVFAAIFDAEDRPLMLPETQRLLEALQSGRNTGVILSVVNDVQTAPEQYDNKSADLLRRLLKDEESADRHIGQLLALAERYGLPGLEIDYEAIGKDEALWQRFAAFVEKLYARFSERGLTLRVVLSWDAPKYITLPDGPEYAVMCYNLHGLHSGPGPKADIAFLENICRLYQPYAERTHMAFATGGFDWGREETSALTQIQAEKRLLDNRVKPERDPDSGGLFGSYEDASGLHTIWYADGTTLALWRETVRKWGFTEYDLFRLGGSNLNDLSRSLWDGEHIGVRSDVYEKQSEKAAVHERFSACCDCRLSGGGLLPATGVWRACRRRRICREADGGTGKRGSDPGAPALSGACRKPDCADPDRLTGDDPPKGEDPVLWSLQPGNGAESAGMPEPFRYRCGIVSDCRNRFGQPALGFRAFGL